MAKKNEKPEYAYSEIHAGDVVHFSGLALQSLMAQVNADPNACPSDARKQTERACSLAHTAGVSMAKLIAAGGEQRPV